MWQNILKVKTCAHMVLSALCKKYITFVINLEESELNYDYKDIKWKDWWIES